MTDWHLRGIVLPEGVERDLYVVDGRCTFTPVEDAVTLAEDVYLLPGLVDAHAHLALHSPTGDAAPVRERVRASARAHLDAGVLAIREPGGPDRSSTEVGPHEGLPRVLTAGRFLAPPGRYFPGLAHEVTDDELPAAALEEHAASGAWVKVIGDFPVPGRGLRRTYTADALDETATRVHEAGGRLAIHCALPEVVHDAVTAGFDSLEHATYLQPDQVASLTGSTCAWVPTCTINEALKGMLPAGDHALIDRQAEVLAAAADAGVTILAGTDAGMGPHGMVRHEMALLLGAGLPVETVLGAGSWTARSFLGLPGIEEGVVADLTAYRADPRTSLVALDSPLVTVLDGEPVRQPS